MKKLMAIALPVFLVFSLAVAPSSSSQSSYILEPGDTITHDGEDYTLTELVGGQSAKIYYNGSESPSLTEGDTVGKLKVTKVAETYVTIEAELPDEEEEEDEENLLGVSELRYKLDSGDVLLFSDDDGVNGAMGYIFGETLNPTFLFWAGGRLPTISKTPVPDEKVSLSEGQSYTSQVIWDLTLSVESIDADKVIVVFETDDSISLMKTTVGEVDISEVVEKLWAEYQARLPTAPQPTTVDMTPIYIGVVFGVFGLLYFIGKDFMLGWGRR